MLLVIRKQQQAVALCVQFLELRHGDVYRQPAMLFYRKTVKGAGHKFVRGGFVKNGSFQYSRQFVDLFLRAYRFDVMTLQFIEEVVFANGRNAGCRPTLPFNIHGSRHVQGVT